MAAVIAFRPLLGLGRIIQPPKESMINDAVAIVVFEILNDAEVSC